MADVAIINHNPLRYMVTFGMHVGMTEPSRSVVEWRHSIPDDCWFAFCKTHRKRTDVCTASVNAFREAAGFKDNKDDA